MPKLSPIVTLDRTLKRLTREWQEHHDALATIGAVFGKYGIDPAKSVAASGTHDALLDQRARNEWPSQMETLASMEWRMIQRALRMHGGNKSAAARVLGISLRTLYNKLDDHHAGSKHCVGR